MNLRGNGMPPGMGMGGGMPDMQPAGLPRMGQVPGQGGQDPRRLAMLEMLGLTGMGAEEEMLKRQLGLAEALRSTPGGPHSTGLGAGLGALAQGIGGVVGGLKQADIMKQMHDLGQQREARQQEIAPLLGQLGEKYRMFNLLK